MDGPLPVESLVGVEGNTTKSGNQTSDQAKDVRGKSGTLGQNHDVEDVITNRWDELQLRVVCEDLSQQRSDQSAEPLYVNIREREAPTASRDFYSAIDAKDPNTKQETTVDITNEELDLTCNGGNGLAQPMRNNTDSVGQSTSQFTVCSDEDEADQARTEESDCTGDGTAIEQLLSVIKTIHCTGSVRDVEALKDALTKALSEDLKQRTSIRSIHSYITTIPDSPQPLTPATPIEPDYATFGGSSNDFCYFGSGFTR